MFYDNQNERHTAVQESNMHVLCWIQIKSFRRMSLKTLWQNVIKDVLAEGDRSRNLMLFGLNEDEGELLSEKVV